MTKIQHRKILEYIRWLEDLIPQGLEGQISFHELYKTNLVLGPDGYFYNVKKGKDTPERKY